MAKVTLEHVTKKFGDVIAVNDVNIDIQDKEFLVLVGPSGCGKSTTLRMVAGLEEISAGNVYIGDRLVNDVAPKDRDIAMVFQSYALYPHMSVYDNLAFGLKLRKTPKAEIDRRVKQAADILMIGELLNRKPKQLSGGQRQRVALGRAIVREPKVFLMDEPLSNLDAKLRVATRAELIKLHQRLQTTIVYVTHDQIEAMTMGTRIAVLKDGLLQQLDTPQNLYDHPINMFVAGFIGSPAMNFFNVKAVGAPPEDLWVEGDGFKLKLPEDKARKLGEHVGEDIVLGIRPEDFTDRAFVPNPAPGSVMNVHVDVTEPMGAEVQAYFLVGSHSFVAKMESRSHLVVGGTLDVVVDIEAMHLFDRKVERTIV
ncbi:MAG: sn-glycerol-3-phosphate ABC transporter ATP-binding protein UgpC [Chloroflexi bacterium]|nr:sn-glycerol-3-phosphate ABC transporter ATP-binding protein UgpC [Chloroflexota bacterium]MDA8217220.1 sn-glycerol-3-phosphate ABC transporter ATP-binding protein UgpC [Dehalococcoidales bacterium]